MSAAHSFELRVHADAEAARQACDWCGALRRLRGPGRDAEYSVDERAWTTERPACRALPWGCDANGSPVAGGCPR